VPRTQGNAAEDAQTITDAETITGKQNTLERAYFQKLAKDPTRRPASQDPEPIKRAATCTQCNPRSELLCNDKILMFLLDNSKIYMLWSDCQTGNTADKGNRGKDRKFD